jgi:hypothetical protein
MTDVPDSGAASAPAPDFTSWFAKEARRNQLDTELLPANKSAIFDVLAAAGLVTVVVIFDGYGDSGQIESIDGRDAHGEVAVPEDEVTIASATYEADIERKAMTCREAIEEIAYDLLNATYGGWENNDGAYGEFTFDVAARSISLDYNGRYTAVESYANQW